MNCNFQLNGSLRELLCYNKDLVLLRSRLSTRAPYFLKLEPLQNIFPWKQHKRLFLENLIYQRKIAASFEYGKSFWLFFGHNTVDQANLSFILLIDILRFNFRCLISFSWRKFCRGCPTKKGGFSTLDTIFWP